MKKLIALLLALCMIFALCACGSQEEAAAEDAAPETEAQQEAPVEEETEAAPVEEETEPVDDGTVTYTITVTDEGGNPIAGAMVQICKETCLPGVTNESGVATFQVAEDAYKASILSMPEGYDYTTEEQEFYFDGEFDVTIVLKAVA